jgi:hypothetical protein
VPSLGLGLGLGLGKPQPRAAAAATLQFALGGANWAKSNGNKTITNSTSENSYMFSQLIGNSGKWIARITYTTAVSTPLGYYLALSGQPGPAGPPSPGAVFTGAGASAWAASMSFVGPIPTFDDNDAIDFIIDIGAGKCWLRKNGALVQGDPVAGTNPSITFTAGINIYVGVGRNNNGSGQLVATLATDIPNVPAGYTPK